MKQRKWFLLAALFPVLASAAPSARQDLATVLASKPDLERGARLFETCAGCHGVDGVGIINAAAPRIAGQYYRVLAAQIVDFRHGKRWDIRMEGVVTRHEVLPKLQDIADVAAYASQLERDGTRNVGDGADLERGQALYEKHCASCHGPTADGDEASAIPRLGGQHADYLARQIYDAVDGRRPALGRTHGKRFKPLEFNDVRGLADYLSRIGWKTPPGGVVPQQPGSAEPASDR
jgi:cytochrome c553